MPRYFIETFGCQMNVNDSEKVAGLLQADGYQPAASAEAADVVFVNTCAVREKAAEKLYHAVGRLARLKRARPELKIGVGGCVAQLEGEAILERAPGIDVLVGTHNLDRIPDLMREVGEAPRGRVGPGAARVELDRRQDAFAVPPSVVAHGNPVRAYVTAMEGCNHVCSFCVVPRTRGPEVNRPADHIVAEVASLVARGFPEVMLLGQTVNAYRYGDVDFADLLERVAAVDGLTRLRFTTSHPAHVNVRLAAAFRDLPRLCPYLHLPPQSGSDRILAAMRRGYTAAEYLDKVALVREARPGLAISGDVIVGYPGETEADFLATADLVERVGFDGLFVFLYSPRPGTTAWRIEDDIPDEEKRRRFQHLNQRQQRRQAERNRARVGLVEEVLVEPGESRGRLTGRTPEFRIVHFDAPSGVGLEGRLVDVEVTASGPNSLVGRLLQADMSLTRPLAVPIF